MFNKAYEEDPNNLVNIYNLAEKHFTKSIRRIDAKEYIDKILARPEEAANHSVKFEIYMFGYTDVNMLECAEYMDAEIQYRIDYKNLALKLVAFTEKYSDSKFSRTAYSYALRGTGLDNETHVTLFRNAIRKFPAYSYFKSYFMMYALENEEFIDEALEVAELNEKESGPTPGMFSNYYAKLLDKKNDAVKINEEYGENYYNNAVYYYLYDMMQFLQFWKDKDNPPVNLLDIAAELYEYKKNSNIKSTYAELLLDAGETEKASEVFGVKYCETFWDDAQSLNSVARYWAEKGKYLDGALKMSLRSVELKPDYDAWYWHTLSTIYWKQKKYEKAIAAEEKALEIMPDYEQFDKQLADIKADMEKAKKGK